MPMNVWKRLKYYYSSFLYTKKIKSLIKSTPVSKLNVLPENVNDMNFKHAICFFFLLCIIINLL